MRTTTYVSRVCLAQGVNLAAYKSAASAADLNDLRELLGYTAWNLYGILHGMQPTRSACLRADDAQPFDSWCMQYGKYLRHRPSSGYQL